MNDVIVSGSPTSLERPEVIIGPRLLDAESIRARLPHREPFLFITHAVVHTDEMIKGTAHWPNSHPIIAGHFPTMGIVPGVCQLEAMAQLAGLLIASSPELGVESVGVLGSIRRAAFKAPVWPNQELALECIVRRLGEAGFLVSGEGRVGASIVVLAEFIVALRPRDALISPSNV